MFPKTFIYMVGPRFSRFNKNGFEKTEIIKKIKPKMGRITNKPK